MTCVRSLCLIAALLLAQGCSSGGPTSQQAVLPQLDAGAYTGRLSFTQAGNGWLSVLTLVIEHIDATTVRASFSDDFGRTGTLTGTIGLDGYDIVGDVDGSETWPQTTGIGNVFDGTLIPQDETSMRFIAFGNEPAGSFVYDGILTAAAAGAASSDST